MIRPFIAKLEEINLTDYKWVNNDSFDILALESKHGHRYTVESWSILNQDVISLLWNGLMSGTIIQKFVFTKASKWSIFRILSHNSNYNNHKWNLGVMLTNKFPWDSDENSNYFIDESDPLSFECFSNLSN